MDIQDDKGTLVIEDDNHGSHVYAGSVMLADDCLKHCDYQKAIEIYSKYAEEGDKVSMCRLGMMYYGGLGVDRRPVKAFELISSSYDPDIQETVYQLGKCHFEGIGTPVDEEKGFEMIISVAEKGHPPAECYVAELYLNGRYVRKNIDRGLAWLEKAVSHEDPKALFILGSLHYEGKYVNYNRPAAMDMLGRSAESCYPPALRKLGRHYLVEEDDAEKGLDMLDKASSLGDAEAAGIIAKYHIKNRGSKDEIEVSIKRLKSILKSGDSNANYYLGLLYTRIPEVRDCKKAIRYFEDGYAVGDERCRFDCAYMKMMGYGTDKDEESAFKLFLEGAEKGDDASMGWVGHCYSRGKGVLMDHDLARSWFQKGIDKGDSYCMMSMAQMYIRDMGAFSNDEYPLKLFRRSFRKGGDQAAFELGQFYEVKLEEKSMPDAIFWYMAGAEKGNCDCMMSLASHYESGAFIERSEEKAFGLYKRAYDKDGSPVAAAEIGRCFEEGIGTEANTDVAVEWYLKAARKNSMACWRLYNIYKVRGDIDRAVFWLRRSATKGSVSAMVELAKMYEEGKTIQKSELKAMKWYHAASDKGDEFAKTRFEELIRYDPQDSTDVDEYETAVRKAGEDGDYDEMMRIAKCLTEGIGMSVDLFKARTCCDIASQMGVPGSNEYLKKIDSMLKGEKKSEGVQMTFDEVMD